VLLGVVSGLIALLGSGQDAAAAEIQVNGPRSCSRAAELRERVEHALGRSLGELGDVSCRVQVVRDGGSYAARVELSSSASQARSLHSFSAKTCPKLMDTLELALVLSVGAESDPSAGGAARQRERSVSDAGRSTLSETSWVADAAPLAKEAPIAKAPVAFTAPGSPATPICSGRRCTQTSARAGRAHRRGWISTRAGVWWCR
jgi:hypothetical protein